VADLEVWVWVKRDEVSLRKLPFFSHILMWLLSCAAFCNCWYFSFLHLSPLLSIPVTKGGLSHHPLKAAAWCVVITCLPFLLHYIEKEGAASLRLHHHHLNFNRDLHFTCNNRRVSRCTCYCHVTSLCCEVYKSTRICVWDFELLHSPFSFCGWF